VQELGAAFAVGLFAALGVPGTVFVRFAVAGLVLGGLARPRLRGLSRREYAAIAALALTLTAMNLSFYEAISRIPLGVAVTVEICGPLVLSVALNRRWPGYILATAHVGKVFANLDALALATALGALVTAPAAVMTINIDAALRWSVAGLVLVVGLMCSVIPYSLELAALRRLPADIFAILASLAPAIAALAGWFVLHQRLGVTDCVAMVMVVVASIGAVRAAPAVARGPDAL
jgi:inner membrane transporter RhtA